MGADDALTAYNKGKREACTLVGNWVEEAAQLASTGIRRYQPWVSQDEDETSVYPTRGRTKECLATFPRVLEHEQQTASQDWTSMTSISYPEPASAKALIEFKSAQQLLGPRERLELKAMEQQAATLPQQAATTLTNWGITTVQDTTYQADFIAQDLSVNKVGARVMMDRDGRPAVRDPTFLAETQLVPRAQGDRVFGVTAKLAGATQTVRPAGGDVPVTIYSEAVATGRYGATGFDGTRPIATTQAFHKNTNFSKPMSDFTKVVDDF